MSIIFDPADRGQNNAVREMCIRDRAVVDTGAPISVPVGDGVKGHLFNVLGDALDVPNSEIKADTYWPIHRAAPGFAELEGSTEMLETGIKSIDLLTPYIKGGKIGLFGGAGVGLSLIHILWGGIGYLGDLVFSTTWMVWVGVLIGAIGGLTLVFTHMTR